MIGGNALLNCPKCNRIIVDSTIEGGVKIRSRMIIIQDGRAQALCPTCKTTVEVPIAIDVSGLPPSNKVKHVIQT